MILIVTDRRDVSSHVVAQYLHSKRVPYKLLYSDEFQQIFNLDDFRKVIGSYTGVWLRRGQHFLTEKLTNGALVQQHITLNEYVHYSFSKLKNCIGSLEAEYNHNKLIDLDLARECGFNIPIAHIFSSREQLVDLL